MREAERPAERATAAGDGGDGDARRPEVADEAFVRNGVERIRAGVARACERSGRDPLDVRLVAAAKGVPLDAMRWALDAGVVDIGHNYVRELAAARGEIPGARWHYIGNLQSHTAHRVAELADVVQTVAGERAARRLAGRAEARGRELEVLIEVDLTRERTGVPPEALGHFADLVAALGGVRLAGLMTLPPMPMRAEDARPHFRRLRELLEIVRDRHPGAVELSMGMSIDYEVGVEEGATMVRIGTGLFGERPPRR